MRRGDCGVCCTGVNVGIVEVVVVAFIIKLAAAAFGDIAGGGNKCE